MGIKPKTSFRHCIPIRCSRWVASHPTHIPRRPKKKPLRGKKVGFAEKKLRLPQTVGHRAYQGWHIPTCGDLPQPTLRGSSLWLRRAPSGASGCAFACMELSTICHLRWRVCSLSARLFVLFHTTRKHITRHHTGTSIACYQKSPGKKCNVAEKRGALF